ncbi:MAG: CRISPR-associated helicase Cas3' [Deltaproteobacteria bacterium]|nr:CRISPR-associated helicase Cas3' [Deltaproteobacteria bacterium]
MTSFREMFEQATGFAPFDFQERLATGESLPDVLSVPTGAGKTAAVVLGWLWRRRFADPATRAETPRRLVYCLPMRTLVEQTESEARRWLERLGVDLGVHVLMGGAVDDTWDAEPDADAILIGTQDQLLSRALNRGYAMSRFRWPIHFGLLHTDTLWIFDETQLMGVGLSTSAQLDAFRRTLGTALPSRSLWMSATMSTRRLQTVDAKARELTVLPLSDADRDNAELKRRYQADKPLTQLPAEEDRRATVLAEEALSRHQAGTKTLVVLNQVSRAQEVYRALLKSTAFKKATASGEAPQVALIHSRFRPTERRERAASLAPEWSGILIATQAIEAGVDLSARVLITEIASWSSLIQRFGRCNRTGREDGAAVLWVDIPDKKGASLPYSEDELTEARGHLVQLDGVGPLSLEDHPVADGPPHLPVMRRRDLIQLFHTDADLSGSDVDVSPFIRETEDRAVQVGWRLVTDKAPPADSARLHRDELCSVPIGAATKLLKDGGWRWNGMSGGWEREYRAIPGQIYLLATSQGGYSEKLGFTGSSKDTPPPVAHQALPPEQDESDVLSTHHGSFVSLVDHTEAVTGALAEVLNALSDRAAPSEALTLAALWHDAGKVHPEFQKKLLLGLPADDPRRGAAPWAKSDGQRRARDSEVDGERPRPHLRHEVASALAWIEHHPDHEQSDLIAYLIASHHGKVRTSLRALPGERPTTPDARISRGVQDGDVLPESLLGDDALLEETTMNLDLMELGGAGRTRSWSERAEALILRHGPFRLAYWEALLRTSDWKASAAHRDADALEAHHD